MCLVRLLHAHVAADHDAVKFLRGFHMSCSSCSSCSCSNCTSTPTPCAEVCTALVISNAWNIPACSASAVLSVPGLETILIGSYLWNPDYGWFRVTAFDSVNFQITVLNECFGDNAVAGTVVPAGAQFVFGAPPSSTQVYFKTEAVGSSYVLTGAMANVVFGTTSPIITITSPGTYLITGYANFGPNGCTTTNQTAVYFGFKRTNNTSGVLTFTAVGGFEPLTGVTGIMGNASLAPYMYTTTNSDDILTLCAYYTGTVTVGQLVMNNATIAAVKLF